ncbi:enoyl-CoA hydratase/isomerase family protein [Chitinibacter sp. S2-10]|uniref:enoyl-CoA hydratase/isomerase family protein n=1 Tax=Chitinibacter sp. S2-10 TaxID=3373597 RepID=UPI003977A3EC
MSVNISLVHTTYGAQIAYVQLNAPERINAQNLAMVRQMADALTCWKDNEQVVAVILTGAGERGFCAGGDLKALYHAMNTPGQLSEGDAFFAEEYRLCQRIREFGKPVLAWGTGIVMGGGWGLFAAASHRIVTENSHLAMPETGIGLFPDVAASWWLPQLRGAGRFLALTGATLNACDALALGAADWVLPDAARHDVLAALAKLPWRGHDDGALLSEFLQSRRLTDPPGRTQLIPHLDDLGLCCERDFHSAVAALLQLKSSDSHYLQHAAHRLENASPTSLYLSWVLQARCAAKSMAETVDIETRMVQACLRYGDFKTGIYSTLFDRRHTPCWRLADYRAVEHDALRAEFPLLGIL